MIARALRLRRDDHLVPILVHPRNEMRRQPLVICKRQWGGAHRAQFRLPAVEVCVDGLNNITVVYVTVHRDAGSSRIAQIAPDEHILVHSLGRSRCVTLGDNGIVEGEVVVKCVTGEARTGHTRRLG